MLQKKSNDFLVHLIMSNPKCILTHLKKLWRNMESLKKNILVCSREKRALTLTKNVVFGKVAETLMVRFEF